MPDNSPRTAYQIDQIVDGYVIRILPYGIFVRLDNGVNAFINQRALSADPNIPPFQLVTRGQKLTATVTQLPDDNRLLQLALVEMAEDPWVLFSSRFSVGDVTQGVVKNLTAFGAFVEIVPGVNGLIMRDQLALHPVQKPDDVVLVGDLVESIIMQISERDRQVRLSLKQRIKQLDRSVNVWLQLQTDAPSAPVLQSESVISPLSADHSAEDVGPILIIDDEVGIARGLMSHLIEHGYEAECATTVEQGRDMLRSRQYKLLFIDVQIDQDDGLVLAKGMQDALQETRIIVMSGLNVLSERSEQIAQIDAYTAMTKPIDPNEVLALVHAIAAEVPPEQKWKQPNQKIQNSGWPSIISQMSTTGTFDERVTAILQNLIGQTHAEDACLFCFDALSVYTSVVAHVGERVVRSKALYGLHQSPVGDVIREQRPILEHNVYGGELKRFDKLLQLFTFQSCIGIPLQHLANNQYALFIFHSDRHYFDTACLRDTLAAGSFVAALIEKNQLQQRVKQLNALLLNGQLAAGMQHEVNNKLSSATLSLRMLQRDCERLTERDSQLEESNQYRQMRELLHEVIHTVGELQGTVSIFQHLMQVDSGETADLTLALARAKAVVYPIARQQRIVIQIPTLDTCIVRGSTNALHQVLLNLMLNAVQHIPAVRDNNGYVQVKCRSVMQGADPFVRIEIIDNGPGIHRKLWERVFSLGFTTRDDGSGQGLFFARSVIESFGGQIYIRKSLMHLGTTFVIELPQVAQGEVTDAG